MGKPPLNLMLSNNIIITILIARNKCPEQLNKKSLLLCTLAMYVHCMLSLMILMCSLCLWSDFVKSS